MQYWIAGFCIRCQWKALIATRAVSEDLLPFQERKMNSLEGIDSPTLTVFKKLYKSLNWKGKFILYKCLIRGSVFWGLSMDYITTDQLQTKLEITTHI